MLSEYFEKQCKYIEKRGKYTCDYIHNSGEVCGRGVIDLKGTTNIGGLKNAFLAKFVVSRLLLNLKYVKIMLVGFMFYSFTLDSLIRTLKQY